MKKLLLFLVLCLPLVGRDVKLFFDTPPQEPYFGYYLYRWDDDPYTNPNIENELSWPYCRYIWWNYGIRVTIPDNEISYFGIVAHGLNEETGAMTWEWSQIVKSTPKEYKLLYSLANDQVKGDLSLKIEIIGDAGTHIMIQKSYDLITWENDQSIIIGNFELLNHPDTPVYLEEIDGKYNFDKTIIYRSTLDAPRKFFRAYKMPAPHDTTLHIQFLSEYEAVSSFALLPQSSIQLIEEEFVASDDFALIPEEDPQIVTTATKPWSKEERPDKRKIGRMNKDAVLQLKKLEKNKEKLKKKKR